MQLPLGCVVEKCVDAPKWVATCNDAQSGEPVYVGPDGGPLPYDSPDFDKRLFDSEDAAFAAVLVGDKVFGLGSVDPWQRQREALERLAECNVKVKVEDEALLNAIEPNQLRAYIQRHGWRKVGLSRRDGIELWNMGVDDAGEDMVTTVVADRRYVDYARSVGHIVRSTAQMLNRSELLVVKEILEIEHANAETELRE